MDGRDDRGLARAFFARHVLVVARDLLGRTIVHDAPDGRVAGRIVEVEAYRGRHDPASHAFRGPTPRAAIMYGPPGHAYVYLSYGVHHCLNVVCEPEGAAAAVLIRSLEPVEGLERMARRRGTGDPRRLASGPGCVAQALGLDRSHNGLDLVSGPLRLFGGVDRAGLPVVTGPRIGIRRAVDRPWRFRLGGHPCVSGPSRMNGGGARARPRAGLPR